MTHRWNKEALELCVNRCDGTSLQKYLLTKSVKKLIKRGEINRLTPLFLYRYCAARFYLRDFSDYTGWEWRDDDGWSAKLFYEPQPLPRWDGGYAERLWVIGEQGVGDEIFWASLLPEALVRVKQVVYECDDRLHSSIRRSFPRVITESRRDTHDKRGVWDGRSGVFIPAGDLMRFFRRDVKHFPGKQFIKPDPERVRELASYQGRTGLAWRGRQGSIDIADFELHDAVCVQYGDTGGLECPVDTKDDFEGLFALCSVLDRVVTVPQSIHHVAGSVGTKVEMILPTNSGEVRNQIGWDYPHGRLPFYPDTYVYRLEEWRERQRV